MLAGDKYAFVDPEEWARYCDRTIATFEAMVARAGGRRTVPQVFIDDRHVGGSDDLAALEAKGELDALIGRA